MINRVLLLDVAKGISILLVAFYHAELSRYFPVLNESMSLIRMPLFFFVSGVLFSWKSQPSDFISRKTDSLLKPYFFTLILLYMIDLLVHERPSATLLGIFYGNGHTIRWTPMWFLTHLWLLTLVAYTLSRFIRIHSYPVAIKGGFIVVCLIVGGTFINSFLNTTGTVFGVGIHWSGLPFSLDILLISLGYFLAGSFARNHVLGFSPNKLLMGGTAAIFLAIVLFSDAQIDLNERIYQSPLFAIIGSLSGIYLVLGISYYLAKIEWLYKPFQRFGAGSLFILIFHYYIGMKSYQVLLKVFDGDYKIAIAAVSLVLSVYLSLAVRSIVLRSEFLKLFYLPLKDNRLIYPMQKVLP